MPSWVNWSFTKFYFIFFIIEVYASYIMALVGIELETLVSESDALTIRPPQCVVFRLTFNVPT